MPCWHWGWTGSILIRFHWQWRGHIFRIHFFNKNSVITGKFAPLPCTFALPRNPVFHVGPFPLYVFPYSDYVPLLKSQFSGTPSLKLMLNPLSSIHTCHPYMCLPSYCNERKLTTHFRLHQPLVKCVIIMYVFYNSSKTLTLP